MRDWPRIWCPLCKATQPLVVADMPADHRNSHAAADLQCAECDLVIATLHEKEAA